MLVNKSVQREMDAALVYARCRLVHRYLASISLANRTQVRRMQIACDTAPTDMVGSGLRD